jgi:hypothetical protein
VARRVSEAASPSSDWVVCPVQASAPRTSAPTVTLAVRLDTVGRRSCTHLRTRAHGPCVWAGVCVGARTHSSGRVRTSKYTPDMPPTVTLVLLTPGTHGTAEHTASMLPVRISSASCTCRGVSFHTIRTQQMVSQQQRAAAPV